MSKYTPGAHRLCPTHYAGATPYIESDVAGRNLALLTGHSEEDFANGRLYASAPELLAICKEALAFFSQLPCDCAESYPCLMCETRAKIMPKLHAVIEKAEGGTSDE